MKTRIKETKQNLIGGQTRTIVSLTLPNGQTLDVAVYEDSAVVEDDHGAQKTFHKGGAQSQFKHILKHIK